MYWFKLGNMCWDVTLNLFAAIKMLQTKTTQHRLRYVLVLYSCKAHRVNINSLVLRNPFNSSCGERSLEMKNKRNCINFPTDGSLIMLSSVFFWFKHARGSADQNQGISAYIIFRVYWGYFLSETVIIAFRAEGLWLFLLVVTVESFIYCFYHFELLFLAAVLWNVSAYRLGRKPLSNFKGNEKFHPMSIFFQCWHAQSSWWDNSVMFD